MLYTISRRQRVTGRISKTVIQLSQSTQSNKSRSTWNRIWDIHKTCTGYRFSASNSIRTKQLGIPKRGCLIQKTPGSSAESGLENKAVESFCPRVVVPHGFLMDGILKLIFSWLGPFINLSSQGLCASLPMNICYWRVCYAKKSRRQLWMSRSNL